jgi:hypothetical protein
MGKDAQVDPIDELKTILQEGEEIGQDLADQGRERTEKGQELADHSRTARNVLENMPPGQSIPGMEEAIEDWRYYVIRSRQERDNYSPLGIEVMTSASGTANIYSSELFHGIYLGVP